MAHWTWLDKKKNKIQVKRPGLSMIATMLRLGLCGASIHALLDNGDLKNAGKNRKRITEESIKQYEKMVRQCLGMKLAPHARVK